MKIYQSRSRRNTWTGTQVGFALVLLMICACSSSAQNNFPSTGNVTIGTTSAGQALSINGNVELQGSNTVNAGIRYVITDQSSAGTGRVVVQAGFGSAGAGGALNLYAHSNVTHPGDVVAGISSASGGAFRVNSSALDGGTDWFYVGGTSGRVGIGTTSPSGILHVSKAADNTVGLLVNDASGYGIFTNDQNTLNFNYGVNATSDGYINFAGYNGGTTQFRNLHISNGKFGDIAYFDGVNSRVGIGTTSPGSKLDVNGVIRNSAANGFSIGNDSGQNRLLTSGTTFQFLTSSNAAAYGQLGGLAITSNYGNTAPSNGLYVEGSVGIGKNPTAPLDVVGDINLTGTIHAKYQDVAEWVPSSEQLSAGTVVVLDSTKSNQVTSSSVSYDTRVAGVVSEQPGASRWVRRATTKFSSRPPAEFG